MLRSMRRDLLAGLVGTTAMTLSTAAERRWRGEIGHPVNPDASSHVATAVGTVLRRQPRTDAEERAYFLVAHWGYGSAVALVFPALSRVTPGGDRRTAVWFWAGCQAMAMSLFPLLGGTRRPDRWRRDVVLSSLVHHAVYAAVVTAAHRRLRPARGAGD